VSIWLTSHTPDWLNNFLQRGFPRFAWEFGELPQEEISGLGLGIFLLLGAVFFLRGDRSGIKKRDGRWRGGLLGLAAWLALFVYMTRVGSEATSRLVAAYYPLLILPILRNPKQLVLVRRRWWKVVGAVSGAGALLALLLTPSRPLWPAGPICAWMRGEFPSNPEWARAENVYAIYRVRHDHLRPVLEHIPPDVSTVGVMDGMDDGDAPLWRPYGHRRVEQIVNTYAWKAPDEEWAIINEETFTTATGCQLEEWVRRTGGIVVAKETIRNFARTGPENWYVLHFPKIPVQRN
jgi:hypothetical protein